MSTLENPSSQLAAVLKFHKAIVDQKFEDLEELFAKEYTSTALPATPNQPIRNKDEGIQHVKNYAAALGFAPLKPYNDDVKFDNESTFIFSLSSGGNIKITAIHDFIDTKLAAGYAAAAKQP